VLSEFSENTYHVGWFPFKYFPVLTEELDERAFLCDSKVNRRVGYFLRVGGMHLMILCFLVSIKLIDFCAPIIDRWVIVVVEYV
jgi:hypothetical protein